MATGRVPTTANSPLTAKGDLFGYSTTQARVAVGNDGETLVADSSTSTGLRWQGDYAAGKNKIINGDFGVWQRGTSFTLTTGTQYTADRWDVGGAAGTVSRQSFTVGNTIAGYESPFYLDWNLTSNSQNYEARQKIEDVRTFAGQTATFSIYAKISAGTTALSPRIVQDFGTGGSPSSTVVTSLGSMTLTSSWQRFTFTVAVPSISGKTLGTANNSTLWFSLQISNTATGTIQLWGGQAEAGSTATAFQTATGTIQGELAACQRYYVRFQNNSNNSPFTTGGFTFSTTGANTFRPLPVEMRVAPSAIETGGTLAFKDVTATNFTPSAYAIVHSTNQFVSFDVTLTGATSGRWGFLQSNNSSVNFIAFSAEL